VTTPEPPRNSAPLLDALLDYARQALIADHAVFSEWQRDAGTLTAVAVAGELTPGAVEPVSERFTANGTRSPLCRRAPSVFDRVDPGTPPGVRRQLERIGAVRELFVPVLLERDRGLFLELYYRDRAAGLGADERAVARRLAPMLAAALARDALAEQNARLLQQVRRSEAARRASEERFRRLLEQLPVSVYETDADGNTMYYTLQGQAALGYSDEEWRRDPDTLWEASVHPDDREWVMAEYVDAVATGRPHEARFRMVARDGSTVWIREYERVFRDDRGRVVSRQGVGIDVTAEVLAEQARLEAERRYRTLIEQLPAATFIDRPDGTSVYVSPQIQQVVGLTPEQWSAGYQNWLDRIHPEDRERTLQAVNDHVRRGGSNTLEYRVVMDDGTVHWMQSRSTVVRAEDGAELVQGVVFDITARREAELALERSEGRLRALVEQMPAVLYVHDLEGHSQFVAPQVEEMLGFPRAAWAHDPDFWRSIVHPDDLDRVAREYLTAIRRGTTYQQEYRMVRADGGVRWINDTAVVLRDADGKPALVQGVFTDVTDSRLAEQLMRESERHRTAVLAAMVAAEEDERHRIAGELHDDSIQVMTATLLSLDRLLRAAADGDLERVGEAARSARDTLADATERTRRLSFELRPPTLEMHGLSRAIRALAEQTARDAGFEITVRTRLRRYSETAETLVYRAIREGLTNARKHARASTVTVSAVERRRRIECEVIDDGIGFDAARVLASDRLRLHFGLDAIAERLRLAGGEFTIDTRPGRGTRLRMAVPASAPEGAG
jgi:PAS domain S-box-containing protein